MKLNNRSVAIYLLALIIGAFSILASCSGKEQSNIITKNENRITVYASFYPMYYFAKKIGGDRIDLRTLIPPGAEPHDWEPGPRDISNLQNASVFIYNGAGMENWVEKILKSINNENIIIVEASKGVDLLEDKGHRNNDEENDSKQYDPHVWLNPKYAKKQLEAVKNALVKADPINKDYYEENFLNNSRKMDELDTEYKNTISKFTRKDIVVTHGAFGYLCSAYELRQLAIEGSGHDLEPSPGKMADIIKFIRENNVKVIFHEELSNPKVAEAVARETGVKIMVLNTLGRLSEKDMKDGKEYFSIMQQNLEALELALK
jgi:zinc transport system substrate-binding protein